MNRARDGGVRSHPFNETLQEDEVILWIGRPNKEIYVVGNRTRHGIVKVGIWASVLFVVAVVGAIYSINILERCGFIAFIAFIFGITFLSFIPGDYGHASWYAVSSKRILLASWDEGGFVIHQIERQNLKKVSIKNPKEQSGTKETENVGTVQCVCYTTIISLLSKNFSFDNIDYPLQVQSLLLEEKVSSQQKFV